MGSLWNRSGMVERYADDIRAAGAKAYFFTGGTTTPLVVYQDGTESAAHPNPVVADAYGRWPDVFVPYTVSYDVRVTTAAGVQLTFTQLIPNPNPVEVSVTTPAESQIQTGMVHAELINTVKSGYVRLNGRTMGNGSSSATERANADTSELFIYLWNNLSDTVAPVSGGRGVSAGADYAANKTITLPDCRGALFIGLDDMGNSSAGNFSGLAFVDGDEITAGSYTGSNGIILDIGNLPAHDHSGVTSTEGSASANTGTQSADHTHTLSSGTVDSQGAHQHDAFIGDDQHSHTTGQALTGAGGGITWAGGGTSATTTTGSSATGVRVRSSAGNAATADDKVSSNGAHVHSINALSLNNQSASHTHSINLSHSHTISSQGSGTQFNNMPLTRLVTWYIKL